MAIERTINIQEKLVPVEIKLSGNEMDLGKGSISVKQCWRDPSGGIREDRERSYSIQDELQDQTQYAGITTAQVMAFFAVRFEAWENAARAAQAESERLAAEAAAAAAAAATSNP